MEKKKPTQVDGAKHKQASTAQNGPGTKKVHIEGQARNKMICAGALYGQYVADGGQLLDFTAFAAAMLLSVPFDLTQVRLHYAALLSFVIVAEVKLKADAEQASTAKQSAEIKRTISLLDALSPDMDIPNCDRGQLAIVKHKIHAAIINEGPLCIPILKRQADKVKEDLTKAEELRDGLVSQANKHMNQVADILKDNAEKLEELRKLFGDEKQI